MTEPAPHVGPEVAEALKETDAETSRLIQELKNAKREQVITQAGTLLNEAFRRGIRAQKPTVKQRWFTIAGYLIQVTARVVRDLEYERLSRDLDELRKQVSRRNVNTPRRTRFSSLPERDKTRLSK